MHNCVVFGNIRLDFNAVLQSVQLVRAILKIFSNLLIVLNQTQMNVREGCTKKTRKKSGLLPNPPPQFGIFSTKKITPIFLLKIASLMAETNFTLGPTFKVVFKARYIFKQLQTKCKTCFGGPRMILHAN